MKLVLCFLGACFGLVASAAATVGISTAAAQGPTPFVSRPLTGPKNTLRIDVAPPDRAMLDSGAIGSGYGLRILSVDTPADDDVFVTLGIGAAFSFVDDFELGWFFLPVQLAPDGDYGDMEVWGRYRFFSSRIADIGVQFALQFPTQTEFGFGIGVPIRLRLGSFARIDLGGEFEAVFFDDTQTNLDLPVAVAFNVTRNVFLGFKTGLVLLDFDDVEAPIGGFLGYTIAKRRALVDITAGFNFYVGDTAREWELIFGTSVPIGF